MELCMERDQCGSLEQVMARALPQLFKTQSQTYNVQLPPCI